MEDDMTSTSKLLATHSPEFPESNADSRHPSEPDVDEEHNPDPSIALRQEGDETTGENEVDKDRDTSDNDSILSDVDEDQFADFDPSAVNIEDRPVAVDDSNINLIGVHKRKRDDGGEASSKKQRKEGRREKPKKSRKKRDEDHFSGGEELDGKRQRKKKDKPRARTPDENAENLTPEERRKKALDRAMDDAQRKPKSRRKKDGIDLEAMADAEIEEMRRRMTDAASADTNARDRGEPAMQKLKLLPDVVALLNKNTLQNSLVDPDLNLLQAVRFFLEPLNDGSLPAYNIQRELFQALGKLPINKDSLVASGIGKVVLFYTKSSRPEPIIKRQAEKLIADWSRPILKRTDDYRKRDIAQVDYDPTRLPIRTSQAHSQAAIAAAARQRALAAPARSNRARVEAEHVSYTIAPKSNVVASEAKQSRNPFTLKLNRGKVTRR